MTSQLRNVWRALRHPNYRLFFIGQFVSLIGTWITSTATSWLIYRLTNSPALLGLNGFLTLFPSFVLAPVAGVEVDRWNRHRILLFTQVASMLQSLALAVLTLTGMITIEEILALSLLQGLINALDMPARQAFVPEMVTERKDLSNAIALNSAMFNGARLLGPPAGGVIIALSNEGVCFLVDTFTYVAVVVSLLRMRLPERKALARSSSLLSEIFEGVRYIAGHRLFRALLLLIALASLTVTPYAVLLPVLTRDVFRQGPAVLGTLMACSGLGAFSAALFLAARQSTDGLLKLITISGFALGTALLTFAGLGSLWPAFPLLFIIGFSFLLITAASNTLLQSLVDENKRGRVMGFFTMAFTGTMPFSSLLSGLVASYVGPRFTIGGAALLCLAGTVLFSISQNRRPSTLRAG